MRKKEATEKTALRKRLSKAIAASDTPAAEVAELEGEEGEAFVDSQQELADELKIDRRSVIRWSREGGAPRKVRGRYDVGAWRDWMEETGKATSLPTEAPSPMKYDLEIRKLTAICEKLELDQKIRLGQYHLNDDCTLWVGKAMTAVRTMLLSLPSKMAPVVEMRPKEECETLLREAIDEALISIHSKEWPTTKAS
jgi:hypothetical protein